MNKNIIIALIFLASFTEIFSSQGDLDEIVSQPDTEVSFLEAKKMKLIVDWTAVKAELKKQNSVWDIFESYTQEHGCGTDQNFISISSKFQDISTAELLAKLNKKENIVLRK